MPNKTHGILLIALSGMSIAYMVFWLIIVPILPLDDDNILRAVPPTPILLFAGICSVLVIGTLIVFTVLAMYGKNVDLLKQYKT